MKNFVSISFLFVGTMDSSKRFACVLVLGVSAIIEVSAQSGFGFNGFRGAGCQNHMTSVRVPILETPQIPEFVAPPMTQQTCNFVKTIVRPPIRRDVFSISPVQRFIQTEPFAGGRNVRFSLPDCMLSKVPAPLLGPGTMNFGSAIPRPGAFSGVMGEEVLGNAAVVAPIINRPSFPVVRGIHGDNCFLSAGPCTAGRGIISGDIHNF